MTPIKSKLGGSQAQCPFYATGNAKQTRQAADKARHCLSRLRELSRKVRQQQTTPEELQVLERLEDEATS